MNGTSGIHMMSPYDRVNVSQDFIDNTVNNQALLLKNGYISVGGSFGQYSQSGCFDMSEGSALIGFVNDEPHYVNLVNDSSKLNVDPDYADYITNDDLKTSFSRMTVAIVSGVCDGFKEVIDSTNELFQNETFQEVIAGISIAGIAIGVPLMVLAPEVLLGVLAEFGTLIRAILTVVSVIMAGVVVSDTVNTIISSLNKYEKARMLAKNAVLFLLTISAIKGLSDTRLLTDSKQVSSIARYTTRYTPEELESNESLTKVLKITNKQEALTSLREVSETEALTEFESGIPTDNLNVTRDISEATLKTAERTGKPITKSQAKTIVEEVQASESEISKEGTVVEGIIEKAINKNGSEFGNYQFKDGVDIDLRGKGTYKDALDIAFKKIGIPKDDFTITKWGKDKYGKSFPVEWKAKNGYEVNIDIGHSSSSNAPTIPHIGWQTGGKRGSGGGRRGHIFVDDVPYNR